MRDPIRRLLDEHRAIMAEVEGLRRATRVLAERGEAAVAETLPVLESVGRMMATRLLEHARREDEALFPAVEKALGHAGGPTAVMREEHRRIHAEAARFRETLRELNEIEHPAIVAQGAALRQMTARGAGADALRDTAEQIIRLLDLHFGKEEDILFPMAREVLSAEELDRVAGQMEALGAA
ncbi:MAG TPA: hemerythrin domain-containing protein [Candidatus Eisenbacteria bacterium]|jgi:hemerythrin-like domain-containing protein